MKILPPPVSRTRDCGISTSQIFSPPVGKEILSLNVPLKSQDLRGFYGGK